MVNYPEETGPMALWKKLSPVKHAIEMLKAVSAHYPCYLATNAVDSSREDIADALKRVGLEKFISGIFCYREIGYKKPEKEYFDFIRNSLGGDKKSFIMVGDNLESDIEGAALYGFNTVFYNPSGIPWDGFSVADHRELLPLILKYLSRKEAETV